MRWFWLAVVVFSLGAPAAADASVLITEVAWMGTSVSANHEWIELHNTGETAALVDGWTLSDGASLLITLSGTIGAGEYVVLERTSDDTVSGTAFLIYTGALVNSGATLTLRRDDGQIEDRVEGGSDWQLIGGDNASKYTAQYDGTRWVTGPPTPGTATVGGEVPKTPTTPIAPTGSTSKPTSVTGGGTQSGSGLASKARSATTPLQKSTAPLELSISSQDVMYVHQPVTFTAAGSGVGKSIIASLQYRWNFGDLTMATGSKVTHRFDHPGLYVVVLQAQFARHNVTVRKEVTVLPVSLSLEKNQHGQILVQNDSVYDVEVSGYRIETSQGTTVFPPLSYIAAKQAVLLPRVAGFDRLVLKDPQQRTVAVLGDSSVGSAVATVMAVKEEKYPVVAQIKSTSLVFAEPPEAQPKQRGVEEMGDRLLGGEEDGVVSLSATATFPEAEASYREEIPRTHRWSYGVTALVVMGVLMVVWWPRPKVPQPGLGER